MPAPIFKIIHNAPRTHRELELQAPQQIEEDVEMSLRGVLGADQFFPKPPPSGNTFILNKSRTCIKQDEQVGQQDMQVKPQEFNKPDPAKLARLAEFRAMNTHRVESGQLYCQSLKDIQETLQEKELLENVKLFNRNYKEEPSQAVRNPIQGHEVTREYRTKMMDWMVEVCTSFKCVPRTYFLATTIFDKYLVAMHQTGHSLTNKVIHSIGVTSMYMASKYEDVFPLHSKVVSEKIAHGSISAKEVVAREREFLGLFDFNTDFVTHFDFL